MYLVGTFLRLFAEQGRTKEQGGADQVTKGQGLGKIRRAYILLPPPPPHSSSFAHPHHSAVENNFPSHRADMDTLAIELLERTLQYLPIRDLLLAQRVCRTWRSLISSSPSLQEALFLRPSKGPFEGYVRILPGNRTHESQTRCSPVIYPDISSDLIRRPGFKEPELYTNLSSGVISHNGSGRWPGFKKDLTYYFIHTTLNPLFSPFWEQEIYVSEEERMTHSGFIEKLLEAKFKDDSHAKPYAPIPGPRLAEWSALSNRLRASPSEASWRKMFVTQPPIKRWSFSLDDSDDEGESLVMVMEDILELVLEDETVLSGYGLDSVASRIPVLQYFVDPRKDGRRDQDGKLIP